MFLAQQPDLQPVFRALADPTRRAILSGLAQEDMSIVEVAEGFAMTRAAVRKHLTVLEEGGLVSVHTSGRERRARLEPELLQNASDWISGFSHFWDGRLNALSKAIEQDQS